MKKTFYLAALGLTILFGTYSCGESDEVKSGKINACKVQKARDQLKLDPTNKTLMHDVEEYQAFLDINRNSASNKNAFDKAINKVLEEGCK